MEQINGKDLICNGSLNRTLTLEELLQFSASSKLRAIHYMQVEGHYLSYYDGIAPEVLEGLPDLYAYNDLEKLDEIQLNLILTEVYNRLHTHIKALRSKTVDFHFKLGREIYEATMKLKFGGCLDLTCGQLMGFITERGSWNDFIIHKVVKAINELDSLAPRIDYGVNNPNTGRLWHKWQFNGDAIFLNFGLCKEEELKLLQTWFKTTMHIQRMAGADSYKLKAEEHLNEYNKTTYYEVYVYMWWD